MGACMSTAIDGTLLHEEGFIRSKLKRSLAASALAEECDPGDTNRLCSNGVSRSCCAHSKQGRKGVNQDRFIALEGCGAKGEATFCGVFDGHGPMGHHVARLVQDCLPDLLLDDERTSHFMTDCCQACLGGGTDEEHLLEPVITADSDTVVALKNAFVDCYSKMDNKLQTQSELNCVCSGTTAITLLVQNKNLVIANVGDSRAILASRRGEGLFLRVEQLTVDFKPDLPGELERIRNCKGRVFALDDEPEVARLWLPHENKPGLAMARAFGDFCLKEYGLSAVPHFSYRKVNEEDEFVVLATDGVWDVMSNEEVANVVDKAEPKGTAAKRVVEAAVRKWKRNFSHVRMDDCAVVCHFLNQKYTMSLSSSGNSQSHSSSTSKDESLNSTLVRQNSTANVVMPCLDRGI